jgi:DNA helicase-2/ATP-dependent DNA helicase PcrA
MNSIVVRKFKEKVKVIKNILDYPQKSLENLVLYISSALNLSIEDKAMAQSVASYIKFSIKDNVSLTLEEISEQLLNVKNPIFKHIADVIYDLQGYEPVPERVTVATCHKSKGLEWDCVFLLGLTDYNYPSSLSGKFRSDYFYFKEEFRNPVAIGKAEIHKILGESVDRDVFLQAKVDVVNEKIRLLYVGITRAKEYMVLMAHSECEGNRKDKPSRYFTVFKEFIESKRK